MLGLFLTFFGAFLAALKGVLTNVFMVGPLRLHPLDLICHMSVHASIQLAIVLYLSGSLQASITSLFAMEDRLQTGGIIIINGTLLHCCLLKWVDVGYNLSALGSPELQPNSSFLFFSRPWRVFVEYCVVQRQQTDVATGHEHWRHRQAGNNQ